jgi:hypothetical protein
MCAGSQRAIARKRHSGQSSLLTLNGGLCERKVSIVRTDTNGTFDHDLVSCLESLQHLRQGRRQLGLVELDQQLALATRSPSAKLIS